MPSIGLSNHSTFSLSFFPSSNSLSSLPIFHLHLLVDSCSPTLTLSLPPLLLSYSPLLLFVFLSSIILEHPYLYFHLPLTLSRRASTSSIHSLLACSFTTTPCHPTCPVGFLLSSAHPDTLVNPFCGRAPVLRIVAGVFGHKDSVSYGSPK